MSWVKCYRIEIRRNDAIKKAMGFPIASISNSIKRQLISNHQPLITQLAILVKCAYQIISYHLCGAAFYLVTLYHVH